MWRNDWRFYVWLPLVATALSACSGNEGVGHAANGAPQMPPPEVVVATAQAGSTPLTRELTGRVVAYRTAEVRARVEGILEKRLFTEGSEVKEGQPLFRIDPRTLEANLASARAALAKARANADVARQTAQRYRQLVKDQAVSKQEFDQAEAQLKQAEAEVISAEAAVKRAGIDRAHAGVEAPISGRIGRAFVTEGALVGRGDATHLATIEQLHPMYVDFTQSGAELLRLRKAMMAGEVKQAELPVELLLEDNSIYPHKGKLLFTEQTVDPNTGTVTLRAQFPNPNRLLLPGMFATVRVAVGALDNAVRVPQRAVQASPQGQFVYVVGTDNKVQPQPVQTAGFSGTDWIVTEGLKGGERVVIDGVQKIRPGAVVTPVDVAAAGKAPAAAAPAQGAAASPAAPANAKPPANSSAAPANAAPDKK